MHGTYLRVVRRLVDDGDILSTDTVLVACGGTGDAEVLRAASIRNATITNLDERYGNAISPFVWERADAEDLPFADESFDWGIVHAGLHHCRSPHRALLELLRISRKGVIVFEARDSALIRLACRLGLVDDYEIDSVAIAGDNGGLRNGPIPNFIYRWSEREVRKTVESAYPERLNDIRFYYGLRLPEARAAMFGTIKRLATTLGGALARAIFIALPGQGNEFGFAILKTGHTKPWILNGGLNPEYRLGFDPMRYRA